MAKLPKAPKPTKPKKIKKRQRLRDAAREHLAKSLEDQLESSFGNLGKFVSKRITKVIAPKKPEAKDIRSKKKIEPKQVKKDQPILDSAKQVHDSVDVVIDTTNHSFVSLSKQVDVMGDAISSTIDNINKNLNRNLFSPGKQIGASGISPAGKSQINAARVHDDPIEKLIEKIKSAGKYLPMLGLLTRIGAVGITSYFLYNILEDAKSGKNSAEKDYGLSAATGAATGAALGSIVPLLGTGIGALAGGAAGLITAFINRNFFGEKSEENKPTEFKKIIFDANKIKFDISNELEFKQRIIDSPQKPPNAGFFNGIIDKMRGGAGGVGTINSGADAIRGGPGGVGSANQILGAGNGSQKKDGSSTNKTPVTNGPIKSNVPLQVQLNRPSRISGSVELEGKQYVFGSGGTGYGSIPYGSYPIGKFDTGAERASMGRSYRKDAFNLPMAIPDPKMGNIQGGNRLGILIHGSSGNDLDNIYTAGCLGISRDEWPKFKEHLLEYQKKHGPVVLDIGPNGARIRPANQVPKNQITSDPQEFIDKEGGKQAKITPATENKVIPPDERKPIHENNFIEPPKENSRQNLEPPPTPKKQETAPQVKNEQPQNDTKTKQSDYQDSRNDLDHRSERKVKMSDTFSQYFSVANNTEDA